MNYIGNNNPTIKNKNKKQIESTTNIYKKSKMKILTHLKIELRTNPKFENSTFEHTLEIAITVSSTSSRHRER